MSVMALTQRRESRARSRRLPGQNGIARVVAGHAFGVGHPPLGVGFAPARPKFDAHECGVERDVKPGRD